MFKNVNIAKLLELRNIASCIFITHFWNYLYKVELRINFLEPCFNNKWNTKDVLISSSTYVYFCKDLSNLMANFIYEIIFKMWRSSNKNLTFTNFKKFQRTRKKWNSAIALQKITFVQYFPSLISLSISLDCWFVWISHSNIVNDDFNQHDFNQLYDMNQKGWTIVMRSFVQISSIESNRSWMTK